MIAIFADLPHVPDGHVRGAAEQLPDHPRPAAVLAVRPVARHRHQREVELDDGGDLVDEIHGEPLVLVVAAPARASKKVHPKVRNHGEGPY